MGIGSPDPQDESWGWGFSLIIKEIRGLKSPQGELARCRGLQSPYGRMHGGRFPTPGFNLGVNRRHQTWREEVSSRAWVHQTPRMNAGDGGMSLITEEIRGLKSLLGELALNPRMNREAGLTRPPG